MTVIGPDPVPLKTHCCPAFCHARLAVGLLPLVGAVKVDDVFIKTTRPAPSPLSQVTSRVFVVLPGEVILVAWPEGAVHGAGAGNALEYSISSR